MKKKKFAIGIDIGGTNIRGGMIDNIGNVYNCIKIPIGKTKNYEEVKKKLVWLINEIVEINKITLDDIKGIGIGCPGLINADKGIVIKSPNLQDFKSIPLAYDISKKINKKVLIENDANVFALGEYYCGSGRNSESMICITVGTGIGGGIILNGNLWRGFSGIAGEVGHIIIKENGAKCGCGVKGCMEQYTSATALVNKAKQAIIKGEKTSLSLKNLTAFEIYKAAKNNDFVAKKIVNNAIHHLGLGLAALVNILNPETIIIGGGVAEAGNFFLKSLENEIKKMAYTLTTYNLKIFKSSLGDKAGIIGAGFLIFEK